MRDGKISGLVLLLLAASTVFAQAPARTEIYRLYAPDKAWALEISLAGFTFSSEAAGEEPGSYHFRAFRNHHWKVFSDLMLDITLEPAQLNGRQAGLDDLIADRLRRAKKGGDVVRLAEYNRIPVCRSSGESHDIGLSYYPAGSSASPFPGQRVASRFRHALHAFFIYQDRFVVIGISGSSLKSGDEKAFYSLLDSIRFADTTSPVTSFDHYSKGRAFFIAAEHRKALEALVAALTLEGKQRQMELGAWRDLLEMSAVALGNAGDTTQAKKILDYGAANDPEYPAFHLWLARYYNSINDLDNTIASLQRAYAGQQKNPEWTKFSTVQRRDLRRVLPDPLTDTTFKKFVKDDKFIQAVKAMTKDRPKDINDDPFR